MWFRLLEDYETYGDEDFLNKKIAKVKRGAPIGVELHFTEKKEIQSGFSLYKIGTLKRLMLSQLDITEHCVKDTIGNVFCATRQMFFKGNWMPIGHDIARQLHYCPLCGKKLKRQRRFPQKENLMKFIEKHPPIDDNILKDLDIKCGRQK